MPNKVKKNFDEQLRDFIKFKKISHPGILKIY